MLLLFRVREDRRRPRELPSNEDRRPAVGVPLLSTDAFLVGTSMCLELVACATGCPMGP